MERLKKFISKFKKLSIREATLSSAIIPALLMFVMLTPYNLYERTNDMQYALQKQGRVLVDQLAQISEYGLITGNIHYLKHTIEELLLDPEIHSIEIFSAQNSELAISTRNGDDLPEEDLISIETFVVQKPEVADVFDLAEGFSFLDEQIDSTPQMTQKVIGSVRVNLTKQYLYSQQRKTIINGLLLAVIALLISAFVGHRIGVSIVNPINAVYEGVKRIRKGKYTSPIGNVSANEVGALALDIDALAEELEKVKKEKEKHIFDLTKARDLADRANASKSDFLALISHEIRSPLNSAYGVVQLLSETKLNSLQHRYLNLALSSFNHLVYLLDDIIDFSSLDYGEIKIETEPVHVKHLVEQVVSNYNYLAQQKSLNLNMKFDGDKKLLSSRYYGDHTRIRQVLTNLLDNAFKYTQHGGIYVLAEWQDLDCNSINFSVTVQDTGRGIPQEKFDTIFEMFKQASAVSNRESGGAGLGLYIVNRLADLMGGRISVKSKPGLGSSFTFELTLRPVKTSKSASTGDTTKRDFSSGQILIVEDDWANQEVIKGLLNQVGISVDVANNGKEGIAMFLRNKYDLVFVDCYMPEMDGFEFSQKVRELELKHKNSRTPLIALTASALASTAEKCLASGMDDYIAKPYRKFDIYKRISAFYKTEKILSNIMSSGGTE